MRGSVKSEVVIRNKSFASEYTSQLGMWSLHLSSQHMNMTMTISLVKQMILTNVK